MTYKDDVRKFQYTEKCTGKPDFEGFEKRSMIIIDESSECSDELLRSLAKRRKACENVPPCPKCKSNDIQLMSWVTKVIWRCRGCKHVYS